MRIWPRWSGETSRPPEGCTAREGATFPPNCAKPELAKQPESLNYANSPIVQNYIYNQSDTERVGSIAFVISSSAVGMVDFKFMSTLDRCKIVAFFRVIIMLVQFGRHWITQKHRYDFGLLRSLYN